MVKKLFIGKCIESSIYNKGEWQKPWEVLLQMYNVLDATSFYLSLSNTFLSILEISNPVVSDSLLNTAESRTLYRELQDQSSLLFSYYLELCLCTINKKPTDINEKINILTRASNVVRGKETVYQILKSYFPDATITNLLPLNIYEWVKISHVYWLWIHLTCAAITVNEQLSLYEKLFRSLFENIDLYIYCNICKEHFNSMKNESEFHRIMNSDGKTIDEKLIIIHERIRRYQDKRVVSKYSEEDYKTEYRKWIIENL